MGILICRTGIGMSIACNKVKNVRCAKVDNTKEAILTREHNNANVIALSARKSTLELKDIILEIAEDLYKGCPISEYSNDKDEYWQSKYLYLKRDLSKK